MESTITILLFFYLILASNFTDNLFSKQLQAVFHENRYAQHLIAFTMLLTIIMIIGKVASIEMGILYAILGYAWFILTTKLDIQWSITLILLLLFGFIYESKLNENIRITQNDIVLSDEEKQKLINTYKTREKYLIGGIIGITVIGACLYANKKTEQYGGGFDIMTFIFG